MGSLTALAGALLIVAVAAQRPTTRGGFNPPDVILGGFEPMPSTRVTSRGRPQVNVGRNNVVGAATLNNPRGTRVNIVNPGGRNNLATRNDPLSVVPSISAKLKEQKRRNEPIALISLWEYVLENDGQGPGPAQRINFEPKTILVPENYVTGRHVPADAGNPLYGESPEAQKLRRDFVMDHLVLDLVDPSDIKLSQGSGIKALTFSKKDVFIRTDKTGKTFVDFEDEDNTKKSVEVTATAGLADGTQIYWLDDFLFDNGIKVAATFEIEQGFGTDSLFGPTGPPLDFSESLFGPTGPPLDLSALLGDGSSADQPPPPPPFSLFDSVAPPSPPFNGPASPRPAGPPAPPGPPPPGVVGPPAFRVDDNINAINEEPRRPFDLGRAQPVAPFGAGGGIGRRPVPFGLPVQFDDQPVNIENNSERLLFDPAVLDEIGRRPSPLFLANRPGRFINTAPPASGGTAIQVEDSPRTGRVQPPAPFGPGGGIGRRPVPFGLPVDFGDTPSAVVETSARQARRAFKSSPREGAPGQMTPSFFDQVRH